MGVAGTRIAPRARRGRPPVEESVVEGVPDLGIAGSPEAEERVVDLFAELLLDILAREAHGASPDEAIRDALASPTTEEPQW